MSDATSTVEILTAAPAAPAYVLIDSLIESGEVSPDDADLPVEADRLAQVGRKGCRFVVQTVAAHKTGNFYDCNHVQVVCLDADGRRVAVVRGAGGRMSRQKIVVGSYLTHHKGWCSKPAAEVAQLNADARLLAARLAAAADPANG